MATLGTLVNCALPPAGDPISLQPTSEIRHDPFDLPYNSLHYYESGTAALAAAISAVVSRAKTAKPEVIIPAYGCPSLISAARYANASPVLVDLYPETPWVDLRKVEHGLSDNTVAILAVNLFGIPERLDELQALARANDLSLIEDGAQSFFHDLAGSSQSDFLILSFGRGKPVSLLGGGLVLARTKRLSKALPAPTSTSFSRGFYIKAIAYNLLRKPCLYWIPKRFPGLGLGATRYSPLKRLGALDVTRRRALPANIFAAKNRAPIHLQFLNEAIAPLHKKGVILDLLASCCRRPLPRLSRYPLLLPDLDTRDALLAQLDSAGLGATAMYGSTLPEIPDIRLPHQTFPAARNFADRLVTLPTHSSVTDKHISAMVSILGQLSR